MSRVVNNVFEPMSTNSQGPHTSMTSLLINFHKQ